MTPSPSTPANGGEPICATPPAGLIALADTIDEARDAFLHAFEGGQTQGNAKAVLERILWDDKGTFAPALRQAAEAASLKARIEELENLLEPFAETARVKGGDDKSKDLRAVINKILENAPYPDDIRAVEQLCNAVLAARAALQSGDAK